jgi:hypothetical protein
MPSSTSAANRLHNKNLPTHDQPILLPTPRVGSVSPAGSAGAVAAHDSPRIGHGRRTHPLAIAVVFDRLAKQLLAYALSQCEQLLGRRHLQVIGKDRDHDLLANVVATDNYRKS